jgi:hypothetical protein
LQTTLASALALVAGIMYVTFVVAFIKDGQRRKAFEYESTASPSNCQPGG